MKKQKIKDIKDSDIAMRNPIRRIHNLDRAERRAQNPDFKELWRIKKEQLLKKFYNIYFTLLFFMVLKILLNSSIALLVIFISRLIF